ncbi:MAG: rRNA maturation RNase YbeY, partial [Firmicutes bacterium]|nr:rRNA maturation RNase YbeY [Bacillota bacterium]
KMTEAARLCLEREGIDPENVEISVSFVSEEEIKELNKVYRNNDSVTDVLSFPQYDDIDQLGAFCAGDQDAEDENDPDETDKDGFEETAEAFLGDVVICRARAKEQAEEFGHSEERELIYLFVHSMFHLLGYDHMEENEKKEMRKAEEDIMAKLDLTR